MKIEVIKCDVLGCTNTNLNTKFGNFERCRLFGGL